MAEDKVSITLAHPLGAEYAPRHGLEAQEYRQGSEVQVTPAAARALIDSGYAAGVEPTNIEQVAAALAGGGTAGQRAAGRPSTSTSPSAGKGE